MRNNSIYRISFYPPYKFIASVSSTSEENRQKHAELIPATCVLRRMMTAYE